VRKKREGKQRKKQGIYEKYIKRGLDIVSASLGLVVLSPIMIGMSVLIRIKLGKPVIFIQERPGKDERIFRMYKFRSMSDARGEDGELLPDEKRLGKFGKILRATSLDELPELVNILKGEMSVVGPRPLLVRDMVFMTRKQRRRHEVRGGLTGLAQVMGRNAIDWETKLELDLKYIDNITFLGDMKIIFRTMITAFIKREGITEAEMATALDYGDYLLRNQKVVKQEYERKQKEAKGILKRK
jgi:lipopolysaccharide/colanic/teichoic acid biosynthesis glycosyltransferase